MNIRLEYLYRDAANYKNWGEVVFSNRNDYDLEWLKEQAREALIDSHFFYAEKVGVPDLHFEEHVEHFDHDWHQFDSFTPTTDAVDDHAKRDISEFLSALKVS